MIKKYVSKELKVFKNKSVKFILAALFIFVLLLGGAGATLYWHIYVPVNAEAENEEQLFEVPSGSTIRETGEKLEEQGLIRSSLVFRQYLRFSDLDQRIISGNYVLSASMSLSQIARHLSSGEVEAEETIVFTIPEGRNVEQIARILEERGLVDSEKFLSLAKDPPVEILDSYDFLEGDRPDLEYALEGYLFPETYEVEVDVSEEEIITKLLDQLKKVVVDKREEIEEIDKELHDLLTLASIIEREARVDHEREIISSVFHNRLDIDQPLESCATVQYAIGELKEVLHQSDLDYESPYNTYQRRGLPPGPIASPGNVSIRAAIHPADTEYRYFVSKGDGSGEHLFAETYEGHLRNRQEVNR